MVNKFKRKYGFNVFSQKLEYQFEYASSIGIHHIEINLSSKEFAIENFNDDEISKLCNLSKLYNVKLSFHIPYYINISEILPYLKKSSISHLIKCIHLASKLKATHVTLHVGSFYWFPVEPWMRNKALKRFVKSMKEVLKLCEKNDVIIALENVVPIPTGSDYYLLGDNIEDFKYIFSSMDSKYLKFCLDTGHANMGEGVLEYINNFKDELCCVHYHDNNGRNDEHLAIGKGTVPWSELAEELININYQGPIISECREIDAENAAITFEKYFNDSLSELNENLNLDMIIP